MEGNWVLLFRKKILSYFLKSLEFLSALEV